MLKAMDEKMADMQAQINSLKDKMAFVLENQSAMLENQEITTSNLQMLADGHNELVATLDKLADDAEVSATL